MQEGMTYREYQEYKQLERVKAARLADDERPRERMEYTPRKSYKAANSVLVKDSPAWQLKSVLLRYRRNNKRFTIYTEKAQELLAGNIGSSISNLGQRSGTRKRDLSDCVAAAYALRDKAAVILSMEMKANDILYQLMSNGSITPNCYGYINEVYFGSKPIRSGADGKYILQLYDAMQAAGVSFDIEDEP